MPSKTTRRLVAILSSGFLGPRLGHPRILGGFALIVTESRVILVKLFEIGSIVVAVVISVSAEFIIRVYFFIGVIGGVMILG